ncbi:MAG TPA: CinA family protein [Rhizomicrobium sp.]|nr:CinA family protein [Rhizomicrobium sp.]
MTAPCIDEALVKYASAVTGQLKARGLTVVTVESCTAGLISAAMSQAEGAATVLHGSFVAYTKADKSKALGVSEALLTQKGSVNAEVAERMALGALERSPADVALAVTGVLGPEKDEDGNPVGLVFISCCHRGRRAKTEKRQYGKLPHDQLRHYVVRDALHHLAACADAQ